ncbi:hypothetical protein [Candidatus Nephthysia bennettiae]|uniref:Glycoside hydrolase family 5 domain-containing protein n=1 Tax=Candidatus Nephthysia bennettiae TaxID=3127016 RepID=A0A934N4E0_9BACT|nr:hypothetical protein [Candidatus Dormibacteraeota bacterium]
MRTSHRWVLRALVLGVLALISSSSISASAAAPVGRVPWAGGSWYLNGVDYPWVHYGNDFGANSWGAYGVHDPSTRAIVDADFARMEQQGIRSARWWLFADGRAGIAYDSGGLPTGLDSYVFPDLDAALALAQKHHVYLNLVLTDVSLLYGASYANGVQMGGRPYLVNTAAGRQALVDRVFTPVFDRYGQNPQILSYEVMNEPEWAISEDHAVNGNATQPASLANFQSFVRQVAGAVHGKTHSYVTVGGAASRWAAQWKGLGLDYYSVHFYDWMHPWPDVDVYDSGCSALNLDRPVVIGEYPPGSSVASFRQYLDNWLAGGCSGAWAWSFKGVDSAGAPDPSVMTAWNAAHSAITAIGSPAPPPTPTPAPPPPPPPSPAPGPGPGPGPSTGGPPPEVRFDFQDGSRNGWQVNWGVGIAIRNALTPHDADERALLIRLAPTAGWPAVDVQTGLEGLAPGKTVVYKLWAPSGAKVTVTPYATDQGWQEHFVNQSTLQPGWNTITWRVPQQEGIRAIGLQFNDGAAWGGRLYLDEVAW